MIAEASEQCYLNLFCGIQGEYLTVQSVVIHILQQDCICRKNATNRIKRRTLSIYTRRKEEEALALV